MDEEYKWALIVAGICLALFVVCMFGVYKLVQHDKSIQASEVATCEKIDGCKKYACMAETENVFNARREWLMKEQNCLLREKNEKD